MIISQMIIEQGAKNMLTEFGRLCRMARMERGELLKEMAAKLGVTPAYLSAVEIGKRNVPEEWPLLLKNEYNLDQDTYQKLKDAAFISQLQAKIFALSMKSEDKDLVVAFARKLNELDREQKNKMLDDLLR